MQRILFPLFIYSLSLEHTHTFVETKEVEEKPFAGKIWALLVAGSYGWDNYRHQAAICQAYHILQDKGIHEENMIVMMYNDLICHTENPTPGEIVNFPNGTNVYEGVVIDYFGEYVTATNFLKILRGDKDAMSGIGSGKVIESGPEDVLFINIAGIGGIGYISFPEDVLFLDDLFQTISWMYDNGKYSELQIYVEANYVASVFENMLPKGKNVFALTADTGDSFSVSYWDNERETYLSDVFSTLWMAYTNDDQISGFNELYDHLVTKVSPAKEYGDLGIGVDNLKNLLKRKSRNSNQHSTLGSLHRMDIADNLDIPLFILKKKLKTAKDSKKRNKLKEELRQLKNNRDIVDHLFIDILNEVTDNFFQQKIKFEKLMKGKEPLTHDKFPCYKRLFTIFYNKFGRLLEDPYNRAHLQTFVNICRDKVIKEPKVTKAMKNIEHDYSPQGPPKNSSCSSSPISAKSFTCKENKKVLPECIPDFESKGDWKIACEDSVMNLECGPSEVLKIMDVKWGRFDKTTCGIYPDFRGNCSSMDDAFFRVRERCHGKHRCSIEATIEEFEDPCIYFIKHLAVKFLCVQVESSSIHSLQLCQFDYGYLECPEGSSIRVYDAFWGRMMDNCDHNPVEFYNCSSHYIVDMMSARCDYLQKCDFHAHPGMFGDPCPGIQKYATIDYLCHKDKRSYSRTCSYKNDIKCPNNYEIHIVEARYGRSHPFICNLKEVVTIPITKQFCVTRNRTTEARESNLKANAV